MDGDKKISTACSVDIVKNTLMLPSPPLHLGHPVGIVLYFPEKKGMFSFRKREASLVLPTGSGLPQGVGDQIP